MNLKKKKTLLIKRKQRVQYKLQRSNKNNYPKIVFRSSLKHLYAQLIDTVESKTLFTVSTNSTSFAKENENKKTYKSKQFAEKLALVFLEKLKNHPIGNQFIFDRGGKNYQGKVKIFADQLKKNDLVF